MTDGEAQGTKQLLLALRDEVERQKQAAGSKGRQLALVVTKLEEAYLWYTAAERGL